jgi:hypothetical protein
MFGRKNSVLLPHATVFRLRCFLTVLYLYLYCNNGLDTSCLLLTPIPPPAIVPSVLSTT